MKTRTLHLPHPAAELFETVYPALYDYIRPVTPGNVVGRLGGGTALAAQWGHRRSTDIDITVPEGTGLNAYEPGRDHSLVRRMEQLGAVRMSARYRTLIFEFPHGKLDIVEMEMPIRSYPETGVALKLRTVASVEGKEFRYASARALVEALPGLGLEPYFMAFHGTVERMVERVDRSIAAAS